MLRRPLRLATWLAAALLLVALLVLAWQAGRTTLALREARGDAARLQGQLVAGDTAGARRTAAVLAGHTATARRSSDGALWSLASRLPWLGDDLAAVRTVSDVADTVARRSLPSAVTLSEAIRTGAFRPVRGRYDLAAIQRLVPTLGRADTVVAAQDDRLQRVDADRLLPVLRGPVAALQRQVASAATAADAGSRAVRLLPGMLGAEGPRTYLLVVQNNAEIRATGGLPGSFSVLRADGGRVTMGFQGASEDVGLARTPVLPLTRAERAVYGENLGTDVRDTNLTPDFPRAAALMRGLFAANRGTTVDGVVAVDPTALAAVMRGTGPVRLAGGERLGADDVVARLLNDAYTRFSEPEEQNDYFSEVARATFDAMMTGVGDQPTVLRGLTRAGREHRLLLWSARPAEQAVIAGSAVSGELPGATGSTPRVGMFLNDATGAKLQYYLDYRAGLTADRCSASGRQTLDATMLLESRVPADVTRLAASVVGAGTFAPRGSMRMNLRIYAPAGGSITQVTSDSRAVPITALEQKGRQVAIVPLLLRPGQKALVSASLRTGPGQDADAVLDFTPGLRSQANGLRAPTACG